MFVAGLAVAHRFVECHVLKTADSRVAYFCALNDTACHSSDKDTTMPDRNLPQVPRPKQTNQSISAPPTERFIGKLYLVRGLLCIQRLEGRVNSIQLGF